MSDYHPEPIVKMLRPVDLKVDPAAQRPHDEAHTRRIAERFDPSLLGMLQVSHRDGCFFIVDGQHRCAAAILAGHGEVPIPCYVVDGLAVTEEAHRFVGINSTVKRPNNVDLFRIRVVAGDAVAVDIERILRAHHLTVAVSKVDGSVTAITSVENIYRGRGIKGATLDPERLVDVLDVLGDAWGVNRDAYDGVILKALALVLDRHGAHLNRPNLARCLARAGSPVHLIGQAKSLADATRINTADAAAQVIVGIYNRGKRSGRLDDQ